MPKSKLIACIKCKSLIKSYFLKDGMCGGCRNPDSIVEAMPIQTYNSSIINRYGDTDSVKTDVATLSEIFRRQGSQLLIDVIAEMTGTACNKLNLRGILYDTSIDFPSLESACEYVNFLHAHKTVPVQSLNSSNYICHLARIERTNHV